MEKECFEDSEIAEVLNGNFISIKVDREERPDIDHMYMEACTAVNGSGGWPLSVFLTHSGRPFFTGTYFPKHDGYQIGFLTVLGRIAYAWENRRNEIEQSGENILEFLKKEAGRNGIASAPPDFDRTYSFFEKNFDRDYGGFFSAPKFPCVFNILFLLRYGSLYPKSNATAMADKTLSSMAEGGLFDHIGGGFFRYSTDRKWLIPHFEKMLYDNALMLLAYSEAAACINAKYAEIAQRIYDYLMREMKGAAFFTAQDADSENVEGKFYTFTPDEITGVLGFEKGKLFNNDYGITPQGNFEGKNLPNRIGKGFLSSDSQLTKLYDYRKKRKPPFKDEKILASSNALLAAALAVSGRLLGLNGRIRQAEEIISFIRNNMYKDGRLRTSYKDGFTGSGAVLDDYAYLLWAVLEIYAAEFKPKMLEEAVKIADSIIDLFGDESGGFFLSGKDITDLPLRQKNYSDGALPSGNAITALCFLRLSVFTEDIKYKRYSDNILKAAAQDIDGAPYGYTAHLCALLQREYGINVKITEGKGLNSLLGALGGWQPFTTAYIKGKGNIAAAFVCNKKGCKMPVYTREELQTLLKVQP